MKSIKIWWYFSHKICSRKLQQQGQNVVTGENFDVEQYVKSFYTLLVTDIQKYKYRVYTNSV